MRFLLFLCIMALTSLSQAVVVLQYHHISTKAPRLTSTPPELFAAHLDYLDKAGFKVISMAHLLKLLKRGEALPNQTAVITLMMVTGLFSLRHIPC